MRNLFFGVLLALACNLASAQVAQLQPFAPTGKTIVVAGATSAPTPVQTSSPVVGAQQYLFVNNGSVTAFIAWGTTSALATTNCVIPTGTPTNAIPIPGGAVYALTGPSNLFFCAITGSSTANIYITPGSGT